MKNDLCVREHLTVLVTGASGLIGAAAVASWKQLPNVSIHAAFHHASNAKLSNDHLSFGRELSPETSWKEPLHGVDVVVHTAAMPLEAVNGSAAKLELFRRRNLQGTIALARQSMESGVLRFIFISTIKVNGTRTEPNVPYTPGDPPNPQDAYGAIKWETECALHHLVRDSDMELVVIRPPLVYGAGVQGNFRSLLNLAKLQAPLPIKAINNQRSFLALDNLVDFLSVCLRHPRAGNQTFLLSDGDDVSTPELMRRIHDAMGLRYRHFAVPAAVLFALGKLLRSEGAAKRLCENLQIDNSFASCTLAWNPPIGMVEGLRRLLSGECS